MEKYTADQVFGVVDPIKKENESLKAEIEALKAEKEKQPEAPKGQSILEMAEEVNIRKNRP